MKRMIAGIFAVVLTLVLALPRSVYADNRRWTEEEKEEFDTLLAEWNAKKEGTNVYDCDEYYELEKEFRTAIKGNLYASQCYGDTSWYDGKYFYPVYIHADVDSEWLRQGNTSAIGIVFRESILDMAEGDKDYEEYLRAFHKLSEDENYIYYKTQLTYSTNYTKYINLRKSVVEIDSIYCDNLPVTNIYVNGEEVTDMCLVEQANGSATTLEFTLGSPLTEEEFKEKYGEIGYDDSVKDAIETGEFPKKTPEETTETDDKGTDKPDTEVKDNPTDKEPVTVISEKTEREVEPVEKATKIIGFVIFGVILIGIGIVIIIKRKRK